MPERPTHCGNCGETLAGDYCTHCGQQAHQPDSLRAFLASSLDGMFSFQSKTLQSFVRLLFRPGELTAAYIGGKRVRYLQPIHLYPLAAGVFFLANSSRPFLTMTEDHRIVSSLSSMKTTQGISQERLDTLAARGISEEVFYERFRSAAAQSLPQFMLGSIVLFALALKLFSPRRPMLTHAVLALHWVAVFMLTMSLERLVPPVLGGNLVGILLTLAVLVHLVVSLRTVYAHAWWRSVVSGFGLLLAFNVILVIWVVSVAEYAFWLAG